MQGKFFFGKMHENGLPDRIPYRELQGLSRINGQGETDLYASVKTANWEYYAAKWQDIISGDTPQWELLWERYEYQENHSDE